MIPTCPNFCFECVGKSAAAAASMACPVSMENLLLLIFLAFIGGFGVGAGVVILMFRKVIIINYIIRIREGEREPLSNS